MTWHRQENLYMSNDDLVSQVLEALNEHGMKRDLSVLGGDPLAPDNIDDFLEFVKEIKHQSPQTKVGVWTGFVIDRWFKRPEKYAKQIEALNYIDIIIDGPFMLMRKIENRRYGSSNQRVILADKVIEHYNETGEFKVYLEQSYIEEMGLDNEDYCI